MLQLSGRRECGPQETNRKSEAAYRPGHPTGVPVRPAATIAHDATGGYHEGMEARDVAAMTAEALNSMEERLGNDIADLKNDVADLKSDVADLKHDIHLLDVKVDVNQRTTEEKVDRGFRQITEHLDRRMDRGFRQVVERLDRR